MYDLVIRDGFVIDGEGKPGFRASVAVSDGFIVEISPHISGEARVVLDAAGKVVCPGFIDMHGHNDWVLLNRPFSEDKVWQGITTQTIGHCGFSAAPLTEEWKQLAPSELLVGRPLEWRWKSFQEYLEILGEQDLGTNVAPFIGYGPVRVAVMGLSGGEPNKTQLRRMCELVAQAMEDGAFGLTTGLAYPPQAEATLDELVELCKVVARYGGLYATHVRNNTYDVASGVKEAIEIAERSGVRVHIAHLQIRPRAGHHIEEVLELMDRARDRGVEVTCDQYPYLAGQGPLTPLLPAWALTGGPEAIRRRLQDADTRARVKAYMAETVETFFQWSDIILWSFKDPRLRGRSIQTLAHLAECDPKDLVIDLLIQYGISETALYFGKTETGLRTVAMWPYAMVGTDGIYHEDETCIHPRTFGTFPRMIRKCVREQRAMKLEEVIFRMTGLPARTLGLKDHGVLAKGKKADIVVFDPDTISDTATYESPVSPPRGILYVIVNGKIVRGPEGDHHCQAGEVLRYRCCLGH